MRLVVSDLACRRAGRPVLAGLSFGLGPGEALVVTGRNGVGKSTLLAALAGLVRPSAGTIVLEGAGERPLTELLHHLGHRDGLKSALTAGENLAFAGAILGRTRFAPDAALAEVGLGGADDLPVAYLSAGQRRRLMLARLLVVWRPLWLLDEPTTALDQDGQALVRQFMERHLGEGGMLVAATHAPLGLAGARSIALGREPAARPPDLPAQPA